jgi:hypothetical protein
MGCFQEWADRKKGDVIIPHQARDYGVKYAIFRKEQLINCIITIAMAGNMLIPLLVIHQKTIDDAVWEEGWWDGQNFMIRFNDTTYVTRSVFTGYLTSFHFPKFEATRKTMNLQNFLCVLLCDNCSSDVAQ